MLHVRAIISAALDPLGTSWSHRTDTSPHGGQAVEISVGLGAVIYSTIESRCMYLTHFLINRRSLRGATEKL